MSILYSTVHYSLFMAPCCILFANKIHYSLDLRCYSSVILTESDTMRSKCLSPCVGWEATPKMFSNFLVSSTFSFGSIDLFIHARAVKKRVNWVPQCRKWNPNCFDSTMNIEHGKLVNLYRFNLLFHFEKESNIRHPHSTL